MKIITHRILKTYFRGGVLRPCWCSFRSSPYVFRWVELRVLICSYLSIMSRPLMCTAADRGPLFVLFIIFVVRHGSTWVLLLIFVKTCNYLLIVSQIRFWKVLLWWKANLKIADLQQSKKNWGTMSMFGLTFTKKNK